ncbi:hypothetical protein DSM03_101988 [Leeuwenhoekiella aestuarii]|uniref:DUF3800 domain-containing protein n=1 Tax=Leeuwenhoekiella aestuarii TaxID=2249426 RepID=A0A4Q0P128_9FLAO|nr:DUF3800 domain-containing protein [Leeuwenhoekiella aestuarii]RXG18306.1 hypothetical protein DSM04_101499 [Leeuwenhoekiella aestuarii]RXG19611.1 hypothetical protein DSM03_101988 [Leeuwenhoekiella aestuarii]
MIDFEISEVRKFTKMMAPTADFDSTFTFYYDETNNIKKFYVRENDFNYTFTANFILGGLAHEGNAPDVQSLIDSFKLQKTATEVKFKHIAKGTFLDCLKSNKLTLFFDFTLNSNLFVHYSSLNILYWAIVDIVDSAVANSEAAMKAGPQFINQLKNDLYKLSRLEIDSVIALFFNFEYPNIKKEKVIPFIEALTSLFEPYLETQEFHFGLESLRQILKKAKKKGSLPFVMDEEDYILLKDLSQFYLRPIYLFKNSTHIFDNEDSISETLQEFKILDGEQEINNYSFVDSKTSQLIQLSDVFVGIMGKLSNYLNTHSREEIETDFNSLTETQMQNVDLLIDLIDKSHNKNVAFLHSTDSNEAMSKMNKIRKKRNKNRT